MRLHLHVLLAVMLWLLPVAASAQTLDPADKFKRMGWSGTDFTRTAVDLNEVISGGPPRDGIPPIDEPQFVAVSEDKDLVDREPVMSVEIGGDARAYPLRIMIWHEIVNDTVGGIPVSVTYCPLCNAAIVFDRRVDGKVLDFGTSGLLRHSDLIMYDRQSESWWQQFTGEAIAGAMTGTALTMVPARLESWLEFRSRQPAGKVLVPNDPGMRNYGRNPYFRYDSSAKPFLYNGQMPEGVPPMERVVVYRQDGKVHAVALSLLAAEQELMHGGVHMQWSAGQASALDTTDIVNGRDVGSVTVRRKLADGSWQDMVHDVTFAFVVEAFHPGTTIRNK
ncbi:MAG: DUF3179 domain-containing protein [Anderseniella sp.]|nr:DUF3179 domain-containing protein [Anderseniella sp.]